MVKEHSWKNFKVSMLIKPYKCSLMPCPFTGPKIFWAVPNFLCQTKIYLQIVEVTNILCQTKIWFAFIKIGFCASTKDSEEALNAVKFFGWLKIFRPAQNILGHVKGQGIIQFQKRLVLLLIFLKNLCS